MVEIDNNRFVGYAEHTEFTRGGNTFDENRREVEMINLLHDKHKAACREGQGAGLVTTACPDDRK